MYRVIDFDYVSKIFLFPFVAVPTAWYILFTLFKSNTRIVWRYQRGNQNSYIEEKQTTHWPKEKVQTTIYKTYIKKN